MLAALTTMSFQRSRPGVSSPTKTGNTTCSLPAKAIGRSLGCLAIRAAFSGP